MDTEQLCGLHTDACIQNLAASFFQNRTKALIIMMIFQLGKSELSSIRGSHISSKLWLPTLLRERVSISCPVSVRSSCSSWQGTLN
jgi:hypothetical protein